MQYECNTVTGQLLFLFIILVWVTLSIETFESDTQYFAIKFM